MHRRRVQVRIRGSSSSVEGIVSRRRPPSHSSQLRPGRDGKQYSEPDEVCDGGPDPHLGSGEYAGDPGERRDDDENPRKERNRSDESVGAWHLSTRRIPIEILFVRRVFSVQLESPGSPISLAYYNNLGTQL